MPTRIHSRIASTLAALALLFALALGALHTSAAPLPGGDVALAQNIDWMSSDQASSLDLSFPVMVPTFIPAPFSGSPAMSSSGGGYSLYWVNYGGPPTFLEITGRVDGSLPAGSPADLNNQLFVNASVQGYEAIHDVTSIYDNVWWIADGVLYEVSSHNMTGTDSLSLANALVALQPPSAPEPEPTLEPEATSAPSTAVPTQAAAPTSAPVSPPTSAPAAEPTNVATSQAAPGPSEEPTAVATEPVGAPPAANETPDAGDETGPGGVTGDGDALPDTDVIVDGDDAAELLTETLASIGILGSDALQDGTGGADLPESGDGTGGILEIAIP